MSSIDLVFIYICISMEYLYNRNDGLSIVIVFSKVCLDVTVKLLTFSSGLTVFLKLNVRIDEIKLLKLVCLNQN
jgi:hypothetical protein